MKTATLFIHSDVDDHLDTSFTVPKAKLAQLAKDILDVLVEGED